MNASVANMKAAIAQAQEDSAFDMVINHKANCRILDKTLSDAIAALRHLDFLTDPSTGFSKHNILETLQDMRPEPITLSPSIEEELWDLARDEVDGHSGPGDANRFSGD